MQIKFGRWSRLASLGAGLATATAIAFSASGTALADTVDTGGTGTVNLSLHFVEHLAEHGIVILADAPATSSVSNGFDGVTLPVTGGNGEVNNFVGAVKYGGGFRVIDARSGRTIVIYGLQLNLQNETITARVVGLPTRFTIAEVGGDISTNETGTPPNVTETFSSDQVTLDPTAAAGLDQALGTHAFEHAGTVGGFTTTFTGTQS